MPRKEFEAFTRLDASDVNTFLMDQSVMTFGSATARDAAIDTPVEGQVTYLTDIDSLSVYNGTQWVTNRPVMSFAGTAARGSAISSPVEGMVTYLEDSNDLQVNTGSAYSSILGLQHINTTPFTSATSVSVNDVFSSSFDNYRILITISSASTTLQRLSLRLRSGGTDNTSTNYLWGNLYTGAFVSEPSGSNRTTETSFFMGISQSTQGSSTDAVLLKPFLSEATQFISTSVGSYISTAGGITTVGTSYDGFTLLPGSGNFTGNVRVYGIKN
jgi:hypothetical protein